MHTPSAFLDDYRILVADNRWEVVVSEELRPPRFKARAIHMAIEGAGNPVFLVLVIHSHVMV